MPGNRSSSTRRDPGSKPQKTFESNSIISDDRPFRIGQCVAARVFSAAFGPLAEQFHRYSAAYGFLLGEMAQYRIDFALPVESLTHPPDFGCAVEKLDEARPLAEEVARFAECSLIGVFLAAETGVREEPAPAPTVRLLHQIASARLHR